MLSMLLGQMVRRFKIYMLAGGLRERTRTRWNTQLDLTVIYLGGEIRECQTTNIISAVSIGVGEKRYCGEINTYVRNV